MKINTAATFAALLVASVGATADAATSLSKAQKLCKAAAAELNPSARSIRIDKREIRSTETNIWFVVQVTGGDGESRKIQCTVDRKSGAVQVRPEVSAS